MSEDETSVGAADSDPDSGDDGAIPARLRDLGAYIRDQRNRSQLSLRNLAKIAGVSNPYLSQIERGLRKPSAEILQAIAKSLHISSETLYIKAGILEERTPEHDLETMIARDRYLTPSQQQALIEMYRSFRQLARLQDVGNERKADDASDDAADLSSVLNTASLDDEAKADSA